MYGVITVIAVIAVNTQTIWAKMLFHLFFHNLVS